MTRQSVLGTFPALAIPNYRRYLSGQSVSLVGTETMVPSPGSRRPAGPAAVAASAPRPPTCFVYRARDGTVVPRMLPEGK